MTTASIVNRIQEVSDPSTQRALYVLLESIRSELAELKTDSIINAPTLSVGSTPENVATTAFQYRIDGVTYTKAAVTAGTALGITDTINTGTATGTFYGGFLAQIDAAGTISFKSVATDQVYTSEAAAEVAIRAVAATAGSVIIGYFVVGATADSAWVAGTDDLTAASDCTSVTFWSAADSHFLTE
jgi:hypothetical protein